MTVNGDLRALSIIAKQREYGMSEVVLDVSGVGTLYHLGQDFANKERLERIDSKNLHVNSVVKEYLQSTHRSLANRLTYLGSLGLMGIGGLNGIEWLFSTGLVGMSVTMALFMIRAGINAADTSAIEEINQLKLSEEKRL